MSTYWKVHRMHQDSLGIIQLTSRNAGSGVMAGRACISLILVLSFIAINSGKFLGSPMSWGCWAAASRPLSQGMGWMWDVGWAQGARQRGHFPWAVWGSSRHAVPLPSHVLQQQLQGRSESPALQSQITFSLPSRAEHSLQMCPKPWPAPRSLMNAQVPLTSFSGAEIVKYSAARTNCYLYICSMPITGDLQSRLGLPNVTY